MDDNGIFVYYNTISMLNIFKTNGNGYEIPKISFRQANSNIIS